MNMTRRTFLKLCGVSATALGLSATDLFQLEQCMAAQNATSVLWLQGSACAGCTVSLLNGKVADPGLSSENTLISSANLIYHPMLMAAAGEKAVSVIEQVRAKGDYIVVVEGGVPTAMNGETCTVWTVNGQTITFMQAIKDLSANAAMVICVGTCAAYGGVAAAAPNPAAVKPVSEVIGKATVNIPGCPPHPDWMLWTISRALLKKEFATDAKGRPVELFSRTVHSRCQYEHKREVNSFGERDVCVGHMGCRGRETTADCPDLKWNGGANWCIGAGGLCIGCTDPSFPSARPAGRGRPGGRGGFGGPGGIEGFPGGPGFPDR